MSLSPQTLDRIAQGRAKFDLNVRHVLVSHFSGQEVEGWIIVDADLDGTFTLIELDTNERLRVNGWNAAVCYVTLRVAP